MTRLACVNIFALPLQILLRRHPEWRDGPAAVVSRDQPHSPLVQVNEEARTLGVTQGMKFSSALSFARGLRSGEVSEEECRESIVALTELLQQYSPEVEPSHESQGVFWLSLAGLELMWPSIPEWAQEVYEILSDHEYTTRIVIGFSKFGTMTLALRADSKIRSQRRSNNILICESPEIERNEARKAPLDGLPLISPRARKSLSRLGVGTVADFLKLPSAGVLRRYGRELHRVHRLASYDIELPLQPSSHKTPYIETISLEEDPEPYVSGLLFLIKRALHPILDRMLKEDKVAAALKVALTLDDSERTLLEEQIRPAEPTLQISTLIDLMRLRLESRGVPEPVRSLVVEIEPIKSPCGRQQGLFDVRPRRDLKAGSLALARIRAEFGDESVCLAKLKTAHMPEGRFEWVSLQRLPELDLQEPRIRFDSQSRSLVRRFFARPFPLEAGIHVRSMQSDDIEDPEIKEAPEYLYLPKYNTFGTWSALTKQPVRERGGPHVVSGGWWSYPVRREYWFMETSGGMLLWVYYNRGEGRWYACGRVE